MSLDGSDTGTREGQESTVLAIVMVASTERTYNAGSLSLSLYFWCSISQRNSKIETTY